MLVSCGTYNKTSSRQEMKSVSGNNTGSVIDFAFDYFRDELNEDLFLLEFIPQRSASFSLTEKVSPVPV